MTSVSIHVSAGFDVLPVLAEFIHAEVHDNHLLLPGQLGEGSVSGWSFPGDVKLYRFRFRLHEALTITTDNPLEIGIFTLFINLSDNAPVNKTAGMTTENYTLNNGIIFFHPTKATTYCPANQWFDFLLISFSQETLSWYFKSGFPFPVQAQKDNFVFIETTTELSRILDGMIKKMEQENFDTSLYLHGGVLNLVNSFLKIAEKRAVVNPPEIHQEDFVRLIAVRNLLKNKLQSPPTIPELAHYSGISESKLKISFKNVFGKSIYQYLQYLRMLEAQRLFLTGKFNISEVAAKVGYQNLTHFSKAFEKHCDIKPAAFLKNNFLG